MDGSISWYAFTSLTGTPVDIVLLYPYKDVSGVHMSGEATQVKRGVSFVIFDVHFSLVAQQKTGDLTCNKIQKRPYLER